jgi:hypothetical protein
MCAMAACGTSGHRTGGPTTTTDATAYATAYTVCLQFNNTDVARNAEPATLTDDQADAIFAGLALQLKPASRKDPGAWSKLQAVADKPQGARGLGRQRRSDREDHRQHGRRVHQGEEAARHAADRAATHADRSRRHADVDSSDVRHADVDSLARVPSQGSATRGAS